MRLFFKFSLLLSCFLFSSLFADVCILDRFFTELVDDKPEQVKLTYKDYSDCHYCGDDNEGGGGHCQTSKERSLTQVLRAKISGDSFEVFELTDKNQLYENIDTCVPSGTYTYLLLDFDTENDSWSAGSECTSHCESSGSSEGTESNFCEIEVPEHEVSCEQKGRKLNMSKSDFEKFKYDIYSEDDDYNPEDVDSDIYSEDDDYNPEDVDSDIYSEDDDYNPEDVDSDSVLDDFSGSDSGSSSGCTLIFF